MDTQQALAVMDGLMRTEAELDAYNVEQRAAARAEALQPLPAVVDLFGDPVDKISRRKMKSARKETIGFARRVMEFGISPLDVAYRQMLRAVERGDDEGMHKWCSLVMPYVHARLASMMVSTPTPAGGAKMVFTWEESRSINGPGGDDSLRAEVVPAANP